MLRLLRCGCDCKNDYNKNQPLYEDYFQIAGFGVKAAAAQQPRRGIGRLASGGVGGGERLTVFAKLRFYNRCILPLI